MPTMFFLWKVWNECDTSYKTFAFYSENKQLYMRCKWTVILAPAVPVGTEHVFWISLCCEMLFKSGIQGKFKGEKNQF